MESIDAWERVSQICIASRHTTQRGLVKWFSAVQYTVQYSTVQYSTVQYRTLQHIMVWCRLQLQSQPMLRLHY